MLFFYLISESIYFLILLFSYLSYKKKKLIKFLISIFLSLFLSILLKNTFKIPRPSGVGYSFPSNHASTAGSMIYFYPKFIPLLVLISLSRVFLRYHRMEDILFGMLLGFFISYVIDNGKVDFKEILRKSIHIFLVFFHLFLFTFLNKLIIYLIFLEILLFPFIVNRIKILKDIKESLKYKDEGDFYPLGVLTLFLGLLIIFLFEKNIFSLVLALSIGDTLNSLGNIKVINNKKLEGIILGSIFVFSVFSIFSNEISYISFLLFFLASLLPKIDNISIPSFLILV